MTRLLVLSIAILLSGLSCLPAQAVEPKLPVTGPEAVKTEHEFSLCWVLGREWAHFDKCDEPEVVEYTDLPIVILADSEVLAATIRAARVWNTELGFELFVVNLLEDDSQVIMDGHIIARYGGEKGGIAGTTSFWNTNRQAEFNQLPEFHYGGKHWQSLVFLFNDPTKSDVMVHELGHALGLDHDGGNVRSIMYPYTSWLMPYIEKSDALLIRRRYERWYPRLSRKNP